MVIFFQHNIRWVDGSPVTFLDWIGDSPRDYSYLNRTIEQLRPKTKRFKMETSEEIAFHKMSMRSDVNEWCSGLVFTTHGYPLGLLKIRCDIEMQASYFCQNRIALLSTSPHLVGGPYHFMNSSWQMYSCEENWLQIDNTCFIMITFTGKISSIDMNKQCEQRFRGSLVRFTNTKDAPEYVVSRSNTNDAMRNMLMLSRKTGIPLKKADLDLMRLFQQFYLFSDIKIESNNTQVEPHELKYKNLLLMLKNVRWPIRTYIKLNNKYGCYFLKESRLRSKKNVVVGNVSCSQQNKITDIVCQRDWDGPMTCKEHHYTCADGTCILTEYKCDGNKDCYQGDDELNCTSVKYLTNATLNMVETQKIRLFSVLCSTFDRWNGNDTESNCLQQHSVCDNIQDMSYERHHCKTKRARLAYYQKLNNNINSLTRENTIFQSCTFQTGEHDSHMPHTFKRSICDTIKCPFMFKCEHSYCILLEKVCDGEIDCPYGADELSCEAVSCPGMLKCRGEKRCLPDHLICNNEVDCIYSTDDELYCQSCPEECVCLGHSLICTDIPPIQFVILYKAITLKFNLSTLLDLSWTRNALFLDISFCHMTNYNFIHTSFSLIVFNISYNDVACLYWEDFYNFKYIHTIDFSHNVIAGFFCSLYTPSFDKTLKLTLKDIIISFNKITVITFVDVVRLPLLRYLDIANNPLHLVSNNIFRYLPSIELIIVPKDGLCCLKHTLIQCSVGQVSVNFKTKCLVEMSLYHQIVWTSLNILGSLLCILFLLYYCAHMRRSKCADSLFVSNIFNAFLLFIIASVYLNMSFSIYNFNMFLHTLRVVGVSLAQISYIFSVMKDCTLTLKVIFPFRHQCRPLRFVPLLCICAWLSLIINGLLFSSDINKSHMINLNDDGKYKFAGISYKINIVILLVLAVTSTLVMLTCYVILRLQNSSATRTGSESRKNKLHLNIFSNLFFQFVLTSAGICIIIVILFTKHTFKVDHLYQTVLYYISALRSFMVAACSVGIHALYTLAR